jgi:type IV secretion system protein TrbL
LLYKPTAAFMYAAAFVTIGDGNTVTDALSGIALMIMSVPALLRLMMPVSAQMSAGGGGGALAGTAVAASVAAGVQAAGAVKGAAEKAATSGTQES